MSLFMHTLESFATLEVLGGEWGRLRERIQSARALPDVVDAVGGYLHAAQERLLLAGSRQRRRPAPALQALIGECLRFAGLSNRVLRRASRAEDALGMAGGDLREAEADEEDALAALEQAREQGAPRTRAEVQLESARIRREAAAGAMRTAETALDDLGRSALTALRGVVGAYRKHLMALLAAVRAGGARLLEWRALTVQFDFNEYYEGRARAGLALEGGEVDKVGGTIV